MKVLILAGAPDGKDLDWESSDLLDNFLEPVARFAGLWNPPFATANGEDSTLDTAVWRSIPLEKARFITGFSQVHELEADYRGDDDFLTSLSQSQDDVASQQILDHFYDHSLAVQENILLSQLPASLSTQGSWRSSFDITGTGSSILLSAADRTLALGTAHLSDLEDLPNANYLQSIAPQTISINLIVGVISVAEPRTIRTRWGTTKSLIELLVGDETRSGFGITFWLSSEAAANDSLLEGMLRDIRRQDIILLRNVALSHFMKKVHGQSLRKGLTKVDLLHRRKIDFNDDGGFYSTKELTSSKSAHPQLLKTRRVWEWVLHFVGGGMSPLGKRKKNGKAVRSWDMPPPDTQ